MTEDKNTSPRTILGYSDKLMEHFENPRNVGSFEEAEDNIFTGMVGSPACGDTMRLQLKINPDTEVIEDVKFKTYGCGSAIASSSILTEWIKGKTLEEAMAIKNIDIAKALDLPPVKVHCSVLAQEAMQEAVEDYRKAKAGEERTHEMKQAQTPCKLPPTDKAEQESEKTDY